MSALYDRLAARYAAPRHRRFYARVVDALAGGADPAQRGRGLDLACGTGASTDSLRRAFPEVAWLGLDCSRAMLARLRDRCDLARLPVYRAAGEALPFADGSLDVVACSFALHWMGPAAIGEIARVLAPGGRLFLAASLRAPSPPLAGNRMLGRALLAERRRLHGARYPGASVDELQSALRAWRLDSLRVATFVERYRSPSALWASLGARGALAALFGPDADADVVAGRVRDGAGVAPLEFGWPVALVVASPPADR